MGRERAEELNAWIAKTAQLQRKMAYVFGGLALLSFGLIFINGTVGGFSLVIVTLVAISAFWVTAAHNAAHRQKLSELQQSGGRPLQTAHRRWRSRS
jgi:hypothetical protein